MEIAIVLLVVTVIVLSAFMLYREFQNVSNRVSALDERVKKLESANRLRMPWDAMNKLLNARAALNREKEERKLGIDFIENAEAWIDQAMATGTKREIND